MNEVLLSIIYIMIGFAWLAGIVIAQGFWATLFAIFIPVYAWYLSIEAMLLHWGVV